MLNFYTIVIREYDLESKKATMIKNDENHCVTNITREKFEHKGKALIILVNQIYFSNLSIGTANFKPIVATTKWSRVYFRKRFN
jgi:hypothetical protein